ncbi:hypothetical protein SAMN05216268_1491, partial [Streptomyces yunnanensis]
MTDSTKLAIEVEVLRERFNGELILPGDLSYDDRRTLYNAAHDKRPAVIALCS